MNEADPMKELSWDVHPRKKSSDACTQGNPRPALAGFYWSADTMTLAQEKTLPMCLTLYTRLLWFETVRVGGTRPPPTTWRGGHATPETTPHRALKCWMVARFSLT